MEPAETPLIAENTNPHIDFQYIIRTSVKKLERKSVEHWVRGTGKETEFSTEYLGWFVQFEGSSESICLGNDMPSLIVGEEIEIVIRKRNS